MSQTSRPQARGPARRTPRQVRLGAVLPLEDRQLLTPVLATTVPTATFTASTANANIGTVAITTTPSTTSAAPWTSLTELTSDASFGGDIVRIKAGPGGDFGKGVYAISRGAGDNADPNFRAAGIPQPINRPGVIYRVDPATGNASVFFDLNTVLSQIDPGAPPGNGSSPGSGLTNWYDIAFDPEGSFDGRPSMFVSSIDQRDPNKNIVYRIGPDGTFLGMYFRFDQGSNLGQFNVQPSALFVPPVEQQAFLRGLFVGDGNGTTANNGTPSGNFTALFFNGNQVQPGVDIGTTPLPPGVSLTPLTFGPQVGFAAANNQYSAPIYAAFTDFGTPGAGGVAAVPGLSGVQGLGGNLLIGLGAPTAGVPGPAPSTAGPIVNSYTFPTTPVAITSPDQAGAIITPFRRFQDIAFDSYGYFSYGSAVPTAAAPVTGVSTPSYVGSMFVTDLASGLSAAVTPAAPLPTAAIHVPVNASGETVTLALDPNGNVVPTVTGGTPLGGRVVRISPNGVVTPFATGFHVSSALDASSFIGSELSITFSADGTTLYVADDDGIWQFKTVLSLADSQAGQLLGLNDLRTLGVPYEGQDSAVAVVDTGVDRLTPNFRGRVATGYNVVTNGFGDDDTAAATAGTTTGGTTTAAGNLAGHGTPLAGVIAQFVPQATIQPVNVFTPNQIVPGGTTPQNIWKGMNWLSQNPYAKDPVRPNKLDRIIAADFGFGTLQTWNSEGGAFRSQKQLILSLKSVLHKYHDLGITPVAAAGQFGTPNVSTTTTGTTTTATTGDFSGMALPAILDEMVSVTGTYPYPFLENALTGPNDPSPGAIPRPAGPFLLYGSAGGPSGTGTGGTAAAGPGPFGVITAPDVLIFKDKLLNAANRSTTTDFAAPAVGVTTFGRTISTTTATTGTAPIYNGTDGFLDFYEGGTSISSAVVTGANALVASAVNYWSNLAANGGATADAYLTQPVGAHVLNFGPHQITDLSAYANPDGINAILQWTAVPVTDDPTTLDPAVAPTLINSPHFREFSRVDVGNAIAAIEGQEALNYLFAHGDMDLIDANKDGLITAQEIQDFVDKAPTIGLPEAGAMARLLGGTDRTPIGEGTPNTAVGEQPDQPDVLQRRYNFFDYAADGQLNGAISIDQYRMLAHNLLPPPDEFTIVDRQAASGNGYLIDPGQFRNWSDLQHILPQYEWVPARLVARFENISPGRWGINRKILPSAQTPVFTLFDHAAAATGVQSRDTPTTPTPPANPAPAPTPTPAPTPASSASPNPATTSTVAATIPTGSSPIVPSASNSNVAATLASLLNIGTGQPATTGPAVNTSLGTAAPIAPPAPAASASAPAPALVSAPKPVVVVPPPATNTSALAGTPSATSQGQIVTVQVANAAQTRAAQRAARLERHRELLQAHALQAHGATGPRHQNRAQLRANGTGTTVPKSTSTNGSGSNSGIFGGLFNSLQSAFNNILGKKN